MAPAGAAAALVLTLLVQASAQEPSTGFADSVEREFAIRAWALQHSGSSARWALALRGGVDEQVSALRAIARGAEFGLEVGGEISREIQQIWPPEQPVELAPQLLAALLEVTCAARLPAPGSVLEAASAHPLPALRLAALDSWPQLSSRPLARAATDPDARVASAARDALVRRLPASQVDLLQVASVLRNEGDVAGFYGLVERLARSAPTESLVDALDRERKRREPDAALEALRLRWFGHGDTAAVARSWPGPVAFEELFTAAARSLRGVSAELGRALLAEAERCDDALRRRALLRGAVEALPPGEVLAVAGLSPALLERASLDLWECLRGQLDGLTSDAAAPWLAPTLPAELRRAVADVLQSALVDEQRADLAPLLVRALEDSDRGVVDIAFEALCDARPVEPWLEPLQRRWQRFDPPRQVAALAELPRGVRLAPFRAELVALAAGPGAASATAFELLAASAPDGELTELAAQRLIKELDALERKPTRDAELRAAGLVRALHEQSGGAAIDELELALEATREHVEVGKVAAWALGQSAAGRERLARWVSADVPSRLRIEAALMRAPFGDESAVSALEGDWPTCDFDLKSRMLRACAANGSERAWAFVERVALDPRALEPHREAALDRLAECQPPRLDALLAAADADNLDVRRYALLALGRCAEPRALERLRRSLGAERAAAGTPRESIEREVEREASWTALAQADELDAALVEAWMRAPLDAAPEQLRARFRGEPQGGSEFSWRPELEVAAALARQGRMLAALEQAGPWWRCDARFLYALGERARDSGDLAAARALYRAAGVGLLGEAPGEERAVRLFDARQRLLEACERLRDWRTFEELAARLVGERRLGRGPARAFERAFGGYDPRRGVDGLARLDAARWQARAWAEVDAGRLSSAREAADTAATKLGASRAARDAQAKLEAALAR